MNEKRRGLLRLGPCTLVAGAGAADGEAKSEDRYRVEVGMVVEGPRCLRSGRQGHKTVA